MGSEEEPTIITYEDVLSAAKRVQGGIIKTSMVKSRFSKAYETEIYLKNEFEQFTGSFKERGALNTLQLLSPEQKRLGVIAASLGNHSQGLSYHGMLLNVPVTVVMPRSAPWIKVQKCRGFGATVLNQTRDLPGALELSFKLARDKGMMFVHGANHPHIIAGQGTVGFEILDQLPEVEAVLIPVGGGGLISGTATAIKRLKPSVKIYGIEPELFPSMTEALKRGEPVDCPFSTQTMADGLAVPRVGTNTFATVRKLIDKMIVVSEDWITRAVLRIAEIEKYVIEGAGAICLAAVMAGLTPELKGKKIVCIMSGGNIDSTLLVRCIQHGMIVEGRLAKFTVDIEDAPGSLNQLCELVSFMGASIRDMGHERLWVSAEMFTVEVKMVCETRNPEHTLELRDLLASRYRRVHLYEKTAEEHSAYFEGQNRILTLCQGDVINCDEDEQICRRVTWSYDN